jgi:dimethylamine--corrinoid protein Co-methyltransferase
MSTVISRRGDGFTIELTQDELMRELEEGTVDAAERGKIASLNGEELKYLFDILSSPARFIGVDRGKEVILTYDASTLKIRRVGIGAGRAQSVEIYEKLLGADTVDFGHVDYSFKAVKPIVGMEQPVLEQALLLSHVPISYGAMPNLALYSQPDGPFPNPSELLPQGKIGEAQTSYEQSVEAATKDMVFAASAMYESGADAINFDTTGSAGDPDFLAALKATEILKNKYPDIPIMLGMANEFVLGMHGEMTYDGTRLAGLYPHRQVRVAEEAGVTVFGPVVNTVVRRTFPWNLARAVTFVKACCEEANIPVHVNMGMGVGAVSMTDHPPVDIVSRASKAMVEICRLDGL